MRLRNNPRAAAAITEHPQVITTAQRPPGGFRTLLAAPDAELNLEVGMGCGKFIIQQAQAQPSQLYLGLEMREEMIYQALLRTDELPGNLMFIWLDAMTLPQLLTGGEVNRIYLNFSDPWPKNRHAKRRLTAPAFLAIYRQILAADGELHFKTDGYDFFLWSKATLTDNGWQISEVSEDLPPQAITTEYEDRYRRRGQPIYYFKAVKA